jgi:hypothetical protein
MEFACIAGLARRWHCMWRCNTCSLFGRYYYGVIWVLMGELYHLTNACDRLSCCSFISWYPSTWQIRKCSLKRVYTCKCLNSPDTL